MISENTADLLHVLVIHRRDATEGALDTEPDFIILDFDLDGETTSRLNKHISTRGIPVIALAKMDAVRKAGSVS